MLIFREFIVLSFYQGIWTNILLDSNVLIIWGKKDFLKIINLYIAKKKGFLIDELFLLGSPRYMNFLSPSAVTVECAWKNPSQEKIRWLSSPTISLDLSKVLKLRVYFVVIPEIWYNSKLFQTKEVFRTCNVLPFSCTHLALWRGKAR